MTAWSKEVNTAVRMLEAAGYEAFLVGGCVRDMVLGKAPKDFDLATNGLPEEVCRVFRDDRVIKTGVSHGTVTVVLQNQPLEITTYRTESGYSDNRHPDRVRFVGDIRDDLSRRDFTINAMAYHPEHGLMDLFHGQEDLANKQIRCVGEPNRRVQEDGLRILRALRFASELGFTIEEETEQALFGNRDALGGLSVERITQELTKLLCGRDAGRILLRYIAIIGVAIPELLELEAFPQQTPYHIYDVLTHTAVALGQVAPEPVLRWSVLLHDIGKPACHTLDDQAVAHFYGHNQKSGEMAEEILRRLKFDKMSRERIVQLVGIHDVQIPVERKAVRRWLNRLTPERFFDLLEIKRADNLAQAAAYQNRLEDYAKLEALAHRILEEADCLGLKELAVNGHDLMAYGYQGREIGERLQCLLDAVLEERVANERQALLHYDGL